MDMSRSGGQSTARRVLCWCRPTGLMWSEPLTLSTKTRIFHSAMYFRTSSKMALRSILTPKRTWTGAIYRKFSKVRFMFVRTKRYISILCQRVIALLTMWRLLTAFTAVSGINRRMVSIISK